LRSRAAGPWRRRSCRDGHAGCCQRFARNYATRSLTPPHDPTLGSAAHLRGCVGTRGAARRCEPSAHRWHARGQGFKSPVSTSQRLWHSGLWAIRIVFTEQRTGSKLSCVGDPSLSAAVPRADAPDGLPADRPIVLPVEGRSRRLPMWPQSSQSSAMGWRPARARPRGWDAGGRTSRCQGSVGMAGTSTSRPYGC
jgi:hypothetical protein